MSDLRRFVVEDGSDMVTLVSGLERRASFEREPDRVVERTIYDTFDWRLHDEGTVLEHHREVPIPPARGGRLPAVAPPALVWRADETGEVLGRIVVDEVPRFAAGLPAGPIAERLDAILEMRALLPLVTIRDEQTALRLLDDEGKTQARVLVDQATMLAAGTDIHVEAAARHRGRSRCGCRRLRARPRGRAPTSSGRRCSTPASRCCRCGATPVRPTTWPRCSRPRSCCARSTATSWPRRCTAPVSPLGATRPSSR